MRFGNPLCSILIRGRCCALAGKAHAPAAEEPDELASLHLLRHVQYLKPSTLRPDESKKWRTNRNQFSDWAQCQSWVHSRHFGCRPTTTAGASDAYSKHIQELGPTLLSMTLSR